MSRTQDKISEIKESITEDSKFHTSQTSSTKELPQEIKEMQKKRNLFANKNGEVPYLRKSFLEKEGISKAKNIFRRKC